ncbi:hypothetical protein JJC00_22120 [Bradyrhizobium diazoefficiens]|uniref:hypothetical protein n=1 Tax=Bradyrhizobium diazoefficiens TaxID=1355477 RepID=UPI00190A8156|nr:hypothetical protein [Bradyrhizobium diazoefficiens]QQO31339.1 hypothetical protein JJC00_22120 [Bradyrhizobium diazoefficiens]
MGDADNRRRSFVLAASRRISSFGHGLSDHDGVVVKPETGEQDGENDGIDRA